jgi:hypothetical protein
MNTKALILDDWLDHDDLPDEDEQGAGTREPVHTVSKVYPFECSRIEYDRAIPNNPYDLHLDEAIRLTLVPAGMYRDRKRYRVKEVLEIAATVQPALEAARWFLSHGEHPERQIVLTGPYIPPPPPDHPKFKSYNPKGHIQYCKLGNAAELWTAAPRGQTDDMTTEQRIGKLTRQVLRKAGIDPDVIRAAEVERDRLWHGWHWRPWCEKMSEKADEIESGKRRAFRDDREYRLTKHLDPKTYTRLKVAQYRRQIAARMEGRLPDVATELQIAVETQMRRLPKPLAKWAEKTGAELSATCREWARRMVANEAKKEVRREKATMKRSVVLNARWRGRDLWDKLRGKVIPWNCDVLECDGHIIRVDPHVTFTDGCGNDPEWTEGVGIHPKFTALHGAAIAAQMTHGPVECTRTYQLQHADGGEQHKITWTFNKDDHAKVLALTGRRGTTRVPIYSLTAIERWIETLPEQDRKLLLEYDVEAEFWRDRALSDIEATKKEAFRVESHFRYHGAISEALQAALDAKRATQLTVDERSGIPFNVYLTDEERSAAVASCPTPSEVDAQIQAGIEAGNPPWETQDWAVKAMAKAKGWIADYESPESPEDCDGMAPPWAE